jgi:hypothetical protein
MSRVWDAARLLKAGESPPKIAADLGLSLSSVLTYLKRAVGEGLVRRSDIYFSFPPEHRAEYSDLLQPYAAAAGALGDMFEDVRAIEVSLHTRIRRKLVELYGQEETGWWRLGVPEAVRLKCQERREKDSESPCEPYSYTDLQDLAKIMESHWANFREQLPAEYASNRRLLLDDMGRLNRIRNKVMHPVRGFTPSDEDFDFVRRLHLALGCEA